METVKVSPEFEVGIPKKIRAALELKPGEELQIYVLDRSIRLQRPLEHPRSIKRVARHRQRYAVER